MLHHYNKMTTPLMFQYQGGPYGCIEVAIHNKLYNNVDISIINYPISIDKCKEIVDGEISKYIEYMASVLDMSDDNIAQFVEEFRVKHAYLYRQYHTWGRSFNDKSEFWKYKETLYGLLDKRTIDNAARAWTFLMCMRGKESERILCIDVVKVIYGYILLQ